MIDKILNLKFTTNPKESYSLGFLPTGKRKFRKLTPTRGRRNW